MPLKDNWVTGESFTATAQNTVATQVNTNTADIASFAYSVKDYGAVGDGVADDTAEIQAAVTAAPNGGAVFFPAGTYKISSAIVCNKSLKLYGSATLKLGANAASLLTCSSASNIRIENLTFDGNRTGLGSSGFAAMYMTDVSNLVMRGCTFSNTQSSGLSIVRGSSIWISNNRFTDIYDSGIRLDDPTAGNYNQYIWIQDNYFQATQVGGTVGNSAVQTYGTGTVSHRYIHILNNIIYLPEIVGLGLDSLDRSNVTGNTIVKDATATIGGECIAITGSENVVAENYCYNDSTGSAAAILLFAIAGRTNDHNQIIGNRCTNGGQGIAFVWGVTGAAINDLLILDNHCYGNNFGVQSYVPGGVASGSQSRILVSHNDLAGNTSDSFNVIRDASGITGAPSVVANQSAGAFVTQRISTPASSATPTINTDNADIVAIYGLATNITSMTTNLSGSPADGDRLTIRIQDNGTARTITWGAKFVGTLLSTTTAPGGGAWKTHVQELIYDGPQAKWAGTFVNTTGY